jgi:hypothetical protein
MNGKGYVTHILPLVASYLQDDMVFMHDSTFMNTSDNALCKIAWLSLELISWLANSPDFHSD